jgi:hypothetical protein
VYSSVVTRRCVSLFVLLCFGFFSIETVVADVHDGDATAAEVAKATAGANVANAAPASDQDGAPANGTTSHTTHVCHCIHAHGGLNAVAMALSAPPQSHDVALGFDVIAPAKVDLDVHLRPPIA